MADFATTMKKFFAGSAKLMGRAASGVASATRFKMSEMDNISRRREAISELGEKVFSLFEAGVELPEEIVPLANEIRALNEGLDTLRADRVAEKAAAKEQRAQERAAAKAAKEAAGKPVFEYSADFSDENNVVVESSEIEVVEDSAAQ